jgi:type II secretory pathway component GspD/PulD (secretin)
MKIIASLFTSLAAIAVSWNVHAQTPGTNDTLNSSSVTNSAATNQDNMWIIFKDVPITSAIYNLARAAGINYILDPKLFRTNDPIVTFRLKNTSPRETLNRMLYLRNLTLNENTVTHVARITRIGQPTNVVDASLLNMDTTNSTISTNGVLPTIEFRDVPLDYALDSLIRESGIKIKLDSRLRITVAGQSVEHNGVTVLDPNAERIAYSTNKWFNPMPTLSFHWENITAKQALIAICQNFDLTLDKNDTNDVIQIKPIEVESRH